MAMFDADFHFYEEPNELEKYFDEPWRTRFEKGGAHTQVGFYPHFTGDTRISGRIQRDELEHHSVILPEEIEQSKRELGVDNVLALSDILLVNQGFNADDDRSTALATAACRYLLDKVIDPDEGIYSAIPVPHFNPTDAVELIDEMKNEDGFVGIYIINDGGEPPFGHRKYEPIYEAAESAGLPVVFHSGASGLDQYHTRGHEKFIETHTLGFLESNMRLLTSLLIQGIPEKFPDLNMAVLESGIFWVVCLMHRLDAEYLKRQSEAPLLTQRPSEYMKSRFYYGTQPLEVPQEERFLEVVLEMIGGADRLIYSSDYPHWDFDYPSVITDRKFLNDAEKQAILGGNARELFGV
jgi:predicted TIM-barrel fold metal-dependent hydrolase